ncbi:MAG: hypothetical protein Q9162_007422, partial [Coniocarpon cinnabarinum]
MSDKQSRGKPSRTKRKTAVRIINDKIVMVPEKSSAVQPAIRRPSKPARVSFATDQTPASIRRDSARTHMRSILKIPNEKPQTPQCVSVVSRKLEQHAPIPRHLPGVRPTCDTCQQAHETVADAIACYAMQLERREPTVTHQRADALQPQPSFRRSSSTSSQVQDMIRHYDNISRTGSRVQSSASIASKVTTPSSPESNHSSSNHPCVSSVSSHLTGSSAESPLPDDHRGVLHKDTWELLLAKEAQKLTKTYHPKADQVQYSFKVSAPLKARPADHAPKVGNFRSVSHRYNDADSRTSASPQSQKYYRFPTLSTERRGSASSRSTFGKPPSSTEAFPRLRSNAVPAKTPPTVVSGLGHSRPTSSLKTFPVLRHHVSWRPLRESAAPADSDDSFNRHEWTHFENMPFLQSSATQQDQTDRRASAARPQNTRDSFSDYEWAHLERDIPGAYATPPESIRSKPKLLPAGFSLQPMPTADMPAPQQIAAYAEDYLKRVNDRVKDWIHRTSFSESPEMWHQEPLPESPVVSQPPTSAMQWVMRAMFGSPTPATPVDDLSYRPSQRWDTNDRIIFGSDGSERPLPVPSQYAARARIAQQQSNAPRYYADDSAEVGQTVGQAPSSTFMRPRVAPNPPSSTYLNPRAPPAPPVARHAHAHASSRESRYTNPRSRFSASTASFGPMQPYPDQSISQQFSKFSLNVNTRSDESDWLPNAAPDRPDTPHSGNTIPMSPRSVRGSPPPLPASEPNGPMKKLPLPMNTDRDHVSRLFADSSATSQASNDTMTDLVEDLADLVDSQLAQGRRLSEIVKEWEELARD